MKKIWKWTIALIALAALGGGGYAAYNQYSATSDVVEEETLQTTSVRLGDIIITTGGTGTVIAATEVQLSFQTGGVITELNTEVGDKVNAGDMIARLEDGEALLNLAEAEQALEIAKVELAASQGLAEDDLDNAYASVTEATGDYDNANQLDSMTQVIFALQQAEANLVNATDNLTNAMDPARDWENNIDNERTATQSAYDNASGQYRIALANYNTAIASLDGKVDSAWGAVADAQESLVSPNGSIQTAIWNVSLAELALESAQLNVEKTTLVAPISGTITEVTAHIGETVGNETLVTIIDLDTLLILFYLEETDLSKATIGNPIEVVFNAWPDDIFAGEIVQIEPTLIEIDGTPALQVWAQVDVPDRESRPILIGMSAEIEVIAGESSDTLLIPIQALRELSPGEYAVFVVNSDGELELRMVEVGLLDFANAEILSGLEAGETISTGIVDTE